MLNAQVKADLQEMKVNATKTRNVRVNRNTLCPDKNECYASNGLGSCCNQASEGAGRKNTCSVWNLTSLILKYVQADHDWMDLIAS